MFFSGIYPREPRNKKKASKSSTQATTFYYAKDIQYLLHEPLLKKFRDHKALSKKIARSLGRGEVGDAARLERNNATKISLDHIIKERYPTFVDALRDLDDALSLLFLFANLPSTSAVPPKTIALCQRLCLEFEHYLIITHSLRKSFLSIKGIYYQATIQGQDILWLVPYKFVQRITGDVDFRIMGTFVEFYTTLLGFVNFRLYTSIGLIYPPKFDVQSDERGGELGAFTLEGRSVESIQQIVQPEVHVNSNQDEITSQPTETSTDIQDRLNAIANINNALEDSSQALDPGSAPVDMEDDTLDTFEPTEANADILPQPQNSDIAASTLFAPFTFFLSRETPRQPLEFIIRAFGCKRIGWDTVLGDGAFTNNESDPTITHQVVDRPLPPVSNTVKASDSPTDAGTAEPSSRSLKAGQRVPGRTYIQPQWVWDCINQGRLLRPDLYAPGATLPPHLSPWIKPTKGAYDPSAPLEAQEPDGEAQEAEEAALEDLAAAAERGELEPDMEDDSSGIEAVKGLNRATASKPKVLSTETIDEFDDNGMQVADFNDEDSSVAEPEDDFGGFSDTELPEPDEMEQARDVHQAELEAEAAGLTFAQAAADTAFPTTTSSGKPLKGILKSTSKGDEIRKKAARRRREEEEELERRLGMLGRKKRKGVERMLYSKRKEEQVAEALRAKRRRIERG